MGKGFTLIEMSIVLVIIGLIVGGVLVGRDLIKAAEVQAEVVQVNTYQTAVTTFRDKYNGLPGDLNAAAAAQFGFTTRAGSQGRGDANGLIEPWSYTQNTSSLQWSFDGEPLLFWADLSKAHLIEGTFTAADAEPPGGGGILLVPSAGAGVIPNVSQYVPSAKINSNCWVTAYSYGGANYFTVISITYLAGGPFAVDNNGNPSTTMGLTVAQAAAIDRKVDDGLATTGRVTATNIGAGSGYNTPGTSPNANPDTASTCYNSVTNVYSVSISNGNLTNCSLSFKFQ